MKKRSLEDFIVDGFNYTLLGLTLILSFYPFYYLFVISFNDGMDTGMGGIYFWPREFTFVNYTTLLNQPIWTDAFLVSVARTVIGTVLGVIFTCMVAYGLSYRNLLFKKTYFSLFIVGMYVSGGMIPFYVVLRNLHLLNSFWVYILPSMLNVFFLLIAVSFFREIPSDLEESAKIDGAGDLRIFFGIIIPISKPLLATMSLFLGVQQWNSWLDSAYFVQSEKLRTLTYRMIEIINKGNIPTDALTAQYASDVAHVTSFSLRVTAMVIAVLPIICVYPFLQKHFVKGAMIGAVKG